MNMSIINIDSRNPENCFCQSQYCKFKKDNHCEKYDKHIIGTAECDGFEEVEGFWEVKYTKL